MNVQAVNTVETPILINTTVGKLCVGEHQHDLQPKSVIRNFHSNRVHRVKRGIHFHDM